jgi:CDP-2,3-bis-(O-geranylgeranyl)-sn-glycerol synthase
VRRGLSLNTNLLLAVVFLSPAFVANATPLVVKNIVSKRHPIDFGKTFIDGRRVFGDSKSWEGLLAGVLTGALVGALLAPVFQGRYVETAVSGFLQGTAAMLGDLANSFLKRRIGLKPGAPLPVLDQVSFMVAALIFVRLLNLDTSVGIRVGPAESTVILLLTLVLHPLTNYIAYLLKLKEVPY